MNRAVFEALEPAQLVELTCRLHTLAMELSERLALNSTNSSRPPSPPFGGGGDATGSDVGRRDVGRSEGATPPGAKEPPPSGRKPGKQPGAKGTWRAEDGTYREPLAGGLRPLRHSVRDVGRPHGGGVRGPGVGAHRQRHPDRLRAAPLRGDAVRVRPGDSGQSRHRRALVPGKRHLLLTERSLVGPSLAAFITALAPSVPPTHP